MKIKGLIYTSLASVLLFASCDLNKPMQFDDKTQAFIAFENIKDRVMEAEKGEAQILAIPLYCASVSGIEASVSYEAEPDTIMRPANLNQDFIFVDAQGNAVTEQKLSFNAEHRFDTIYVKTINDNDLANIGDKRFAVVLKDAQGCNLGAHQRFTVTISDDEDPMNRLVGKFKATGISLAFDEATIEWELEIERDEAAANKLWFNNILDGSLYGLSFAPVYAVADTELQIITMRRGQTLYGSEDDGSLIVLGCYGNIVNTGGAMTVNYTENDDVVTIPMGSNYLSPYRPSDEALFDAVGNIVYTK